MVLVAGSANLDFVVRAQHIPGPGETVLGHHFQTFPGGKGANQAVACAKTSSVPTHFLTALGQDSYAQPIEASLQAAGVQLHAIRSADTPTGTAFICVGDNAENAITVAPGANSQLLPSHWPQVLAAQCSHLLMQLETPLDTVSAYAQAARQAGLCVALNAAPAQALPASLLANIDILILNEGELATLSPGQHSVLQSMELLAVPTVIVTLGARGCCALQGKHWLFQPGFAVDAVDTTAAGDTFCGCLIAALAQGQDLSNALRQASAAAALACTQWGAQSSVPSAQAMSDFLATQASTPQPAALQALRAYCTNTAASELP